MLPLSSVRRMRVRTFCHPCLPAAPGLMVSTPRLRSGMTLRLPACCSRVDGEHSEAAVGDDLEDVAVSAHEDLGLHQFQSRLDAWRIPSRIAANVGHHHLHPLGSEDLGFLETPPEVLPIGIAPHGSHLWSYRLNLFDESHVAYIAGMPNLVAAIEVLCIAVVPVAVSVAYDAYGLHLVPCCLVFTVKENCDYALKRRSPNCEL